MLVGMRDSIVHPCPEALRARAVEKLLAARDSTLRESLAQAATMARGAATWDGLLIVGQSDPTSALWVQPMPGNAAVVWPPPANDPAADVLFRSAASFIDDRRFAVAQMIVTEDDGFAPGDMEQRGFPWIAHLVYLFADLSHAGGPIPQLAQSPQFVPYAGNDEPRLSALIERTYVGTLDCPQLDGVRLMSDVVEGYRAQGKHRPDQWYFIVNDGQDVGVLVLAEHPSVGNWELVYMGVAPEARGRRLGEAIARFAVEAAARGGAEGLVLAVDAANEPARATYARLGFHEWDRRTVFARLANQDGGN